MKGGAKPSLCGVGFYATLYRTTRYSKWMDWWMEENTLCKDIFIWGGRSEKHFSELPPPPQACSFVKHWPKGSMGPIIYTADIWYQSAEMQKLHTQSWPPHLSRVGCPVSLIYKVCTCWHHVCVSVMSLFWDCSAVVAVLRGGHCLTQHNCITAKFNTVISVFSCYYRIN